MASPRELQSRIHANSTPTQSDVEEWQTELANLYNSGLYPKYEYNDHVIREFNKRCEEIGATGNMARPFDAGRRFVGSSISLPIEIDIDVSVYHANVRSRGGTVSPASLAAADRLMTALKRVPSGQATTILSKIRHLWCPICDGTSGYDVTLHAGQGDLVMAKLYGGGVDTYSLTGGLTFDGVGGLAMGFSEQDVGATNLSYGAWVLKAGLNAGAASEFWLGSHATNAYGLAYNATQYVYRTFHKNTNSYNAGSYGAITGLWTADVHPTNSWSRIHHNGTYITYSPLFNNASVSRATHSYSYGGKNAGASMWNPTTARLGMGFVGYRGFDGAHLSGFYDALYTFMSDIGRMP